MQIISLFINKLFGTQYAEVQPYEKSFYAWRLHRHTYFTRMTVTHVRERSVFRGKQYLGINAQLVVLKNAN